MRCPGFSNFFLDSFSSETALLLAFLFLDPLSAFLLGFLLDDFFFDLEAACFGCVGGTEKRDGVTNVC